VVVQRTQTLSYGVCIVHTLPLEIHGMTTNVTTPVLYALGALTTGDGAQTSFSRERCPFVI
jgi:hypothetical protein